MNHLIWLSDLSEHQREAVGNKAARLKELMTAGFPVPPGFCITRGAYDEHVLNSNPIQLSTLIAEGQFDLIAKHVQQMELKATLVSGILAHYRQLVAESSVAIAVRSSATAEDLAHSSFAGLYETILNIKNETALLEAVRQCWASYWSLEAVFYRNQVGIDHTQHAMAVLVQVMVQPKWAGVIFTQNPLDRAKNSLVIEVTQGEGEALVGGEVRGERFLANRESQQLLQGTRPGFVMADTLLNRLVSVGLAIEDYQASPQDIEWAVDANDCLWILQTRSITVTGEPDSLIDLTKGWERAYDEPFSPLGCDLARRRHTYWVRAINSHYKTNFTSEMESSNNFLYYQSSWQTPGLPVRLWKEFWKLVNWLQARRTYQQYIKTVLPSHERRLAEIAQQELTQLDDAKLWSGFKAAIGLYLDLQYTSYPLVEVTKTSVNILDRLSRFWFGANSNLRISDFLSGLDNLTVTRDLALHRLGQLLRQILPPDEIAQLDYPMLSTFKDKAGLEGQFWHQLQLFLTEYGYVWADRYPRDPAWEINQEALIASLVHTAQTSAQAGLTYKHAQQQEQRRQAVAEAAGQLSGRTLLSPRRALFSWLLRRAEQLFPHKENRNHYVYQGVMVIRNYAQEVGSRLKKQGRLPSEEDIFFLTEVEIEQVWTDSMDLSQLRQTIADRKLIYYRSKHSKMKQQIASLSKGVEAPSEDQIVTIDLTGEPCSPGVATGHVRLISGLGELQRVQPGDIVICSHMRPAWSTVFVRAGGVVVETGSLLSHGATLAREYGVPAVMNIPGITQMVREGDRVKVDGHSGTVMIERVGAHG